ncbi:MAG: oligosaccharide flippase family protein [Betaproteobacteria bacterium]|nr:oligosaccharide flippase family protein [Betaproteobacteria bacterium]
MSKYQKGFLLKDVRGDFHYVGNNTDSKFVLLPEILTWIGRTSVLMDEPKQAEDAFGKAIAIKLDYWPPYFHLGEMLRTQGKKTEALDVVRSGLKYSPSAKALLSLYSELGGKPGDIPAPTAGNADSAESVGTASVPGGRPPGPGTGLTALTTVRRSLVHSSLDSYSGVVMQLIGTMVIARLLTPAELGVFAVAAVFAALASTFRDFGVAEYLIQEQELSQEKIRPAFAANILVSWAMGLVLFLGSGFAAEFYRHQGVADVMRVQAVNFALIPFGAVTMAYFRRQLDFKPIFVAGFVGNLTGLAVATLGAL